MNTPLKLVGECAMNKKYVYIIMMLINDTYSFDGTSWEIANDEKAFLNEEQVKARVAELNKTISYGDGIEEYSFEKFEVIE